MYKLLLVFLFPLFLYSQTITNKNPNVYTSLGDKIYNNIANISDLKKLEEYKKLEEKIDGYILKVNKTKEFGFQVESGSRSNLKLDYLKEIRKLSKVNDYFVRSVESSYKVALESQDNNLFMNIVNSGLLNTQKYHKSIMQYYNQHKMSIKPDGFIQIELDKLSAKKDAKKRNKKRYKTKKQLQEEKIARLKANDILKQERLEKKLAEELEDKKKKIQEEQEKELFN